MVPALAAVLILYAPGALVFRWPAGDRAGRAALPASERAFWAIVLSVVWSIAVVLALAAGGVYRFERLLALNAGVCLALIVVHRRRLAYDVPATRPAWSDSVPIALVVLSLWLYFPPSELVTGGIDPGTYLNEGVRIAQTGRLVIADPTVASVPAPFRDLFFPSYEVPWYYSLRFMGFFILSPDEGTVIGQFPHFFPASIAIGYGLNGLSGARQAIGAWAMLGLVAVFLVGARLFGPLAGAVAAFLLAINVIEVWFARYPNTELPSQALLFGAILAFGRLGAGRLFFGALAGSLLGLQLLLRYDVVLAIAAFAATAAAGAFAGLRAGWAFPAALVATVAIGLFYLAELMAPYAAGPFLYSRSQGGWVLIGLLLAGLVALRWSARFDRWATFVRRAGPVTLGTAVAVLAVYAYFFRQPGGRLALADAMAFRSFAWYMMPWGLAAAVAGFMVTSRSLFWRQPAFFVTLTVYALFFFYKLRIVPEHFWASRRFLSVILPGAILCAVGLVAVTIDSLARRQSRSSSPREPGGLWAIARNAAVLAAALPLGVAFLGASTRVLPHVELAGIIPRLERLTAQIGDSDLLLVESRNSSDTHVLALPLAYIYARNVLVLANPTPDKELMSAFVAWAGSRYARVLFLGAGGTDLVSAGISATPVFNDRFEVPEYESPMNAYPAGARSKKFSLAMYELGPDRTREPESIDVEIGGHDDVQVLRFHAKEYSAEANTPFRWTTDTSYVVLPWTDPSARQVTIWMSAGGRPAAAPRAEVEVSLDDRPLGVAVPTDDIQPYAFEVPPDLSAALAERDHGIRLRLRVAPWKPNELLGTADDRELGVIVTRVTVR
jgi:hypothetical protein